MAQFSRYSDSLRRLIRLYIDYSKLTLAEKLTRLLSIAALTLIIVGLSLIALFFATFAVAELLSEFFEPYWAFLIVVGFYCLLILAVVLFSQQLIFNPIARFLSSILLNPPQKLPDE